MCSRTAANSAPARAGLTADGTVFRPALRQKAMCKMERGRAVPCGRACRTDADLQMIGGAEPPRFCRFPPAKVAEEVGGRRRLSVGGEFVFTGEAGFLGADKIGKDR